MPTTRERFALALELLPPSDWELFEQLASEFLVSEFPDLRTLAAPTGDGGRDAALFIPDASQSTVFQYSLASDWALKIKRTLRRLSETFPGQAKVFIYVSNQAIGAKADELRAELSKQGLFLDIRDRNWFLERANTTRGREIASARLADRIVEPFLASKQVEENKALALSGRELRVAAVHLGLQWEDDTREKGLTKLSFEALVKAVLRDSSPEKLVPRAQLHERVRAIVPNHPADIVDKYCDAAVLRLNKRAVRHYRSTDEFCLASEERERLHDRLAELEQADREFQAELLDIVQRQLSNSDLDGEVPDAVEVAGRVRRLLEEVLFTHGEQFANAVRTGDVHVLGLDGLDELVTKELATNPLGANSTRLALPMSAALRDVVTNVGPASRPYLRRVADSYTLLAFLREMPDVQAAMVAMFSNGEIWLDTSMVLPLLAEVLVEDEASRGFTEMLRAAVESGLKLRITDGVAEEIERHINGSLTCLRQGGQWRRRTPFLLAMYLASGRAPSQFQNWTEHFVGHERPQDDIVDYLKEFHTIELGSLETEMERADAGLRAAVHEIWHSIHERRRGGTSDLDDITRDRLVRHDVENYLGVVVRRGAERTAPLGSRTWWLTLDRGAFEVRQQVHERLGTRIESPVMSADFLVNYLAFGPVRRLISKGVEAKLPVIVDIALAEFPSELLEVANQVRESLHGEPERIVRRRVRDELDKAKMRRGRLTEGGSDEMRRQVEDSIQQVNQTSQSSGREQ